MRIVIMAGGKGERLRPITLKRPKPLVPLLNKPLILHIMHHLMDLGFDEFLVTTVDRSIKDYLESQDLDADLLFSFEKKPLGTAGSVKLASKYLDDTFVVFPSDIVTNWDLVSHIKYHREKKAEATIGLKKVEDAYGLGLVGREKSGRISRFEEKPRKHVPGVINTGVYVLEPGVLDLVPAGEKYDFGYQLFPRLVERGGLFGYSSKGYWVDIGTPSKYLDSVGLLLKQRGLDTVWMGDDVELGKDVVFEGAVMVQSGCRIGSNAFLRDCVLMKNTVVGEKARITESIVCENCVVGEGAVLAEDLVGDGTFVRPGFKAPRLSDLEE